MTTPAASARKPIVAGNWKMNYGPSEARAFAQQIVEPLGRLKSVERVLCPPAIAIEAVRGVVGGSGVVVGAQNMFSAPRGAFPGEISPVMLQGLCHYVILGHSERRTYFGETSELVNQKAIAAYGYELRPIVCVGEHLEDRDAGRTERVLTEQVRGSLANLPVERLSDLVVAYEPVWAIGTGRAATTQDATDAATLIRALLGEMYSPAAAARVRVQYGGSVTTANIAEFAALPEIDGALVGGASLKPEFVEIVRLTAVAKGLPA
ncbi:MAG TPA: triose-phosphate isomerase [Ktedonobacterales bacterium]|nr:triose-phosphate isomerase [Ktedonobacterales bacterium]